jgi:hypothetical protein
MQHASTLMAILILVFAALVLLFYFVARLGKVPYVRPIPGVTAIEEAVGRATELGRPIIFVMGVTDLRDIITHAALSVLERVAQIAASMRATLVALVRKPDVYPFVESIVREAYRSAGEGESFNAADQVRYLSDDAIVYAMSAARTIEETEAGCAMFCGQFDFTSLLMTEPGARRGVLQIAADPLLNQMPFFVCTCDYTIIGEEYFAAGAYVSADPALRGAVASQDYIKLVFVLLILFGVACLLVGEIGGWAPGAQIVAWLREQAG